MPFFLAVCRAARLKKLLCSVAYWTPIGQIGHDAPCRRPGLDNATGEVRMLVLWRMSCIHNDQICDI